MSDKPKTNPNKVNQYTGPDPRQSLFLKNYLDPKSKTFSNAYQSAVEAGYEEEYAKVILHKDLDWLSEHVKSSSLVQKAEKRLNQLLDFDPVDENGKLDNSLIANQFKGTQLVLKGLAKDRYSERQEVTGRDGQELKIVFDNSFKE